CKLLAIGAAAARAALLLWGRGCAFSLVLEAFGASPFPTQGRRRRSDTIFPGGNPDLGRHRLHDRVGRPPGRRQAALAEAPPRTRDPAGRRPRAPGFHGPGT